MIKNGILKKVSLAILFVSIIVFSGAVYLWHLYTPQKIKKLINTQIKSQQYIEIQTNPIKINKKFPFIIISTSHIEITNNSFSLSASNIKNKLSILKYMLALITKKQYYGKLSTDSLYVLIKKTENNKKTIDAVPIIPIDAEINSINIKYLDNTLKGSLKIKFEPAFNRLRTLFIGKINNLKTEFDAKLSKHSANISYTLSPFSIKNIHLSNSKGAIMVKLPDTVVVKTQFNLINYKNISLKNATVKTAVRITKKQTGIDFLDMHSSNGYKLKFRGSLNFKDIKQSNIKGCLSTPYIKIKPILQIQPQKIIKEYVLDGSIKINRLCFTGMPNNEKFIKSGSINIKKGLFRIDKKSSTFFIQKGTVSINKQIITAAGNGHFKDINFHNSKIIIQRTKGYPCDMNLNYEGNADDISRIFLEENIIAESDMKIIGKTRKLKGNFSATTTIKGYRWGPKPYFNFKINIHSNGVELINANMPSKFIKSWGDIEIKRVMQFGKIKDLYLRFKNLKVKGKTSMLYTKDTIIHLLPKIKFTGTFNTNLSNNDLNYLEKSIVGKLLIKSNTDVSIYGKINGYPNNFSFRAKVQANTPIISQFGEENLKINVNGSFKNNILNIPHLTINKNLEINGTADMKNFIFTIHCKAKDFHIANISSILESRYMILKNGTLSGTLNANLTQKGALHNASGCFRVKNGYHSENINSIFADIEFKNNTIYIDNASLKLLNNPIHLKGRLSKSKYALFMSTDNFFMDLNSLKHNAANDNITIAIPKKNIEVHAKIDKITLKLDNTTKSTENVNIFANNSKTSTSFKIESDDTKWQIKKTADNISLHIKDYIIMPLVTNFDNDKNMLKIDAKLKTDNKTTISIKNISGSINIISTNGKFKNVSNALKLLSATNIIEIIVGHTKLNKDLPYNKIIANLQIEKGIVKTAKKGLAALYGKNLNIFADGEYNILNNYMNVYLTFTTFRAINTLISHIPIMGWIVGGKERSFSGISLRVKGYTNKTLKIQAVPIESLGKGFLHIIQRTLTLPFNAFGVVK